LADPIVCAHLDRAVAAEILARAEEVSQRLAGWLARGAAGDAGSLRTHLQVEELPAAAARIEAAAALHHGLEGEDLDDRPDGILPVLEVLRRYAHGALEPGRVAVVEDELLPGDRREGLQALEVLRAGDELGARPGRQRQRDPERHAEPAHGS